MRKKVYVFDFDHTLITVNSFRMWTIEFFLKWRDTYSFRKNLLSTFVFLIFYFLRLFRIINHSMLKYLFLKVWIKYFSDHSVELRNFVENLFRKYGRKCLLSIIGQVPSNAYLIISTAAPYIYAKYIYNVFPRVDRIHATSINQLCSWKDFVENKGIEKVRNLYDFLKENGINREDVLLIFFTDHADDLPLMKISDKIFLVKGTKNALFQLIHFDEEERCFSYLTE